MTTDELVFIICNQGEPGELISRTLIDPKRVLVFVVAEDVWFDKNRLLKYNYSDRIIVSPINNLKYGWLSDEQINDVIRYTDIHKALSVGIQQSVLRQIRVFELGVK